MLPYQRCLIKSIEIELGFIRWLLIAADDVRTNR